MKKLLWLIGSEFKLLWRTIAIVFAVLTLFLAALFGVISVAVDLTRNICENLDEMYDSFDFTIYYTSYGEVQDALEDRLVLGAEDGLTMYATLYANGKEMSTYQIYVEDETDENGEVLETVTHIFSYSGSAVCLNEAASSAFEAEKDMFTYGTRLTDSRQICLSDVFAEGLEAEIGDTVTIYDDYSNEYSFTVAGIYRMSENSDDITYNAYLISMDEDYIFYELDAYFNSSMDMYNAYTALRRSGYVAVLHYWIDIYFDNISTITAFLIAAAVVFALTSVVLMCALANICFRHRKAYICQLKMLGCNNFAIFCIYCGMALFALLAAAVVASLFALAFNSYFMGLCADIMGMQFSARLYAYIPVAAFFALAVFTVAVYLLFSRKTMSATVAQEIRHE